MDKITHEMRLTQWTSIVRKCRNSGMSIRSWCIENNINEKQFHYWQRRVRGEVFKNLKKTELENNPTFVQLPVPADSIGSSSFKADIIIHTGNSTLELSNTVSEELLSKVLKVLSNVK